MLGMRQPMMVLARRFVVMKLIHVLSLFLVVIGGLHFALSGIGIDLLGTLFGTHLTTLYVIMGISTLYHVVPMLTTKLNTL
jgi:uncharacterized membrane protein YuzA (DUF378 family)